MLLSDSLDAATLHIQHNFIAFQARIHNTGLPGFHRSAVSALNGLALGPMHPQDLTWAVCWIQHCGEYLWWVACQEHMGPYYSDGVQVDKSIWQRWMEYFHGLACLPQAPLPIRLVAQDTFCTMVRLKNSLPNPKFDKLGPMWWDKQVALQEEAGVPDICLSELIDPSASDSDSDEESYESDFDPLRPIGGYLPYAIVTEKMLGQISPAA